MRRARRCDSRSSPRGNRPAISVTLYPSGNVELQSQKRNTCSSQKVFRLPQVQSHPTKALKPSSALQEASRSHKNRLKIFKKTSKVPQKHLKTIYTPNIDPFESPKSPHKDVPFFCPGSSAIGWASALHPHRPVCRSRSNLRKRFGSGEKVQKHSSLNFLGSKKLACFHQNLFVNKRMKRKEGFSPSGRY